MQAFQMDLEQFRELETQILAVSGDDIETHRKFAEKYGITFPLISDRLRTVKELYGYVRKTYLIDKKGIIQFIQKGVPQNRDLIEKLREIESQPEKKE